MPRALAVRTRGIPGSPALDHRSPATGKLPDMASSDGGQVTDQDAAARQAAEVAVELSEAEQPPDRGRLTRALNGVARSAGRVGRGTAVTKRGTDAARPGTGAAKRGAQAARRGAGTVGRGASSAGNWLAAQVVAMGPRLRI